MVLRQAKYVERVHQGKSKKSFFCGKCILANSEDPNQIQQKRAPDQGLNSLPKILLKFE